MVTTVTVKKPRGFKIALMVILVLFLLFAAAIYCLPHFLPVDTIRGMAKSRAAEYGLDVDFAGLGFSWSGSVVLDGITVSRLAENGSTPAPLLTMDEVRTNVSLVPLLSGRVVVNSVNVNGFALKVRREADGSLNLPQLPPPSAATAAVPGNAGPSGSRAVLLSAATAAEPTAAVLPPIELRRLELNNGVLAYEDAPAGTALDVGLDFLRVEGGATLDDPFVLSGRLFPYTDAHDKGELPFTGRVAVIRNQALNPDGEASLQVDVKAFSLGELAAKLGLGGILSSGTIEGVVNVGYAERKGLLSVSDMRMAGVGLGLDGGRVLALPDSTLALNAEFDSGPGSVNLVEASFDNEIAGVRASGSVQGIYAPEMELAAAVSYDGSADFARVSAYAAGQGLAPGALPEFDGDGKFSGKIVLGRRPTPSDPMAPTFSLDFSEGRLGVRDAATGIAVDVGLPGVGVIANAVVDSPLRVNANLILREAPITAAVPRLSTGAVGVVANGGLAVVAVGGAVEGEIRLANTRVAVPATPWAGAMEVLNPETRITYSLEQDLLAVHALTAVVNGSVNAAVPSASVSGLAAGDPRGEATLNLTAPVADLRELLRPSLPELLSQAAGTLRAATRVAIAGGMVEATTNAEADGLEVGIAASGLEARVAAPQAVKAAVAASLDLANPLAVSIRSLRVDNDAATVQLAEQGGLSAAGTLGKGGVAAAGTLDLSAMRADLTSLTIGLDGMAAAIGRDGSPAAEVSAGVMRIVAATPENALRVPLSAEGDFSVASLDAGADNLVFHRIAADRRETSDLGALRAKLGVNGYIGSEKEQAINLKTAVFQTKPVVAQARGRANLTTGAVETEYAARLAPEGLSSVMAFLRLPPAMITNADVRGVLSWNGTQLTSKGEVAGQLRLASGEINPFQMAHDLSAAHMPAERSLAVEIRQLSGNVRTGSGEPVATLAAQPSNLLLSRDGPKGQMDIRVQGAAGPTRMLILGLVGVIPQLGEYSQILNRALAQGTYNSWLIVSGKDANTLALNLGGIWEGAALAVDNVPYLAEAGKLSAAVEGEYAFRENRMRLGKLFLRSDSAQMQADGAAEAVLAVDSRNDIGGLASLNVSLKFVMADLQRAARVFPGVLTPDLGLAGRVDGSFTAGGNADDIRVGEGAVRFQGFRAAPGGTELAVPSGTANFGATISLHGNPPAAAAPGQESPYDVFRLFNLSDGQASLTGASIRGRPVETLAGTFDLQNGVLTLRQGRMAVGGDAASGVPAGGATAAGTVDFNSAAPAANLRISLANVPMSEVNSEIAQYAQFDSGIINLPPAQGQTAGVAFRGFSEDEILRTISLDNFNFATGPVRMTTGPVLNAELDRARGLMRQEVRQGGEARVITFQSITGTVEANGQGGINIPGINVTGDNTGDFKADGTVHPDHTLDLNVYVMGKLENIIGFTLPNLIPNLRSGTDEEKNRFMATMNENAAKGHYSLSVTGPLDDPDISGIGRLAGRFLTDIFAAAPAQIIGGVLDLGKDAPGTILNLGQEAAGALLHPGQTLQNAPGAVVHSPGNLGRELGRMFGIGPGASPGSQEGQTPSDGRQQPAEVVNSPGNLGRELGRMFGIGPGASQGGQEGQTPSDGQQQPAEEEERRGGFRLPFPIH